MICYNIDISNVALHIAHCFWFFKVPNILVTDISKRPNILGSPNRFVFSVRPFKFEFWTIDKMMQMRDECCSARTRHVLLLLFVFYTFSNHFTPGILKETPIFRDQLTKIHHIYFKKSILKLILNNWRIMHFRDEGCDDRTGNVFFSSHFQTFYFGNIKTYIIY